MKSGGMFVKVKMILPGDVANNFSSLCCVLPNLLFTVCVSKDEQAKRNKWNSNKNQNLNNILFFFNGFLLLIQLSTQLK